ncbi:MAG: ABC transporter ATP-binding protein [Candidatus Binatia bacterium]
MSSNSDVAISVQNLGKCYRIYDRPQDRLKQSLWRRRQYFREFWALKDVSFEVKKGETVGIIGRNGSGKSTLLQLIAGTVTPTTGSVHVNGRVAALLELGSGFNPEFTGRENVYTYASVLGLSRKEIDRKFQEMVDFSEVEEFIDMPVKTYSSGMFVRLAFSIAINVDPDILVVDEALAVGDGRFQQRCVARIKQLQNRGTSILFVSHDIDAIKRLCNYVLVLERGRVVHEGDPLHMTNWYLALMTADFDIDLFRQMEEGADERDFLNKTECALGKPRFVGTRQALVSGPHDKDATVGQVNDDDQHHVVVDSDLPEFKYFRHGDGNARIIDVFISNGTGDRAEIINLGETITISIVVEFNSAQAEHLVGFYIRDRLGTDVIGINTYQERITPPPVYSGDRIRYDITIPIYMRPGIYSLSPSVAYHQDLQRWMDYIENAVIFRVVDAEHKRTVFGVFLPPGRKIEVEWQNHPKACQ